MKKLFVLITLLTGIYTTSFAQVTSAALTASGLTCSMCSRAIYKSLVNLPAVAEVREDIEHSEFQIQFKPGSTITPDQLRKAVTDAGFAIASLKMTAVFHDNTVENDTHLDMEGNTYHFLDVKKQQLSGTHTFTVVDRNFVSAAQFRKYGKLTSMKCYETGVSENCCHSGSKKGSRIYHITL